MHQKVTEIFHWYVGYLVGYLVNVNGHFPLMDNDSGY